MYVGPGIDSLLSSIRVLNEKVGTIDEEEEFKLLEKMLQSNNFKKAKEVSIVLCLYCLNGSKCCLFLDCTAP